MAGDSVREGQDISRRIREELERIREAESRVEEALETVRQARRRVEVVARELGREEDRVRSWVREELKASGGSPAAAGDTPPTEAGGDGAVRSWRSDPALGWASWRETSTGFRPVAAAPAPGSAELPTQPGRPAQEPPSEAWPVHAADAAAAATGRWVGPATARASASGSTAAVDTPALEGRRPDVWKLAGAGVLALLAVALVGWFAIRGLGRESEAVAPVATEPAPIERAAPQPSAPAPVVEPPAAASPLTALPTDPAARQAVYDSLFAARSPLFDPLLAALAEESDENGIERALDAWRENAMDAQYADVLHSALLQRVLKAGIDPRIEIDGQVLRNPCRGRSCSALLNVWAREQQKYGLPPVPANASTDPRALRQAEATLVLSWLREANAAAVSATGAQ